MIMKLLRMLLLAMLSSTIFFACSTGTKSGDENTENADAKKETCTYSYNADSTAFKWTAYKFTTRAGVSGTFDDITVTNTQTSENKLDVLTGAEFSITTGSVNSGNPERDPKVVEFFFGKLANTGTITGKINSIKDGEAVISLKMNDKNVDIVGHISEDGDKVSLTAKVDMNDFDGMEAVTSLNEKCHDKHTGEDGESKLWPDVSIEVSTVLNKACN